MAAGFKREAIDLPEGRVDYYVAGSGHDVVYLHPAAGMRVSAPLSRLAGRFRVWAPIVPGFDGTPLLEDIESMPALADLIARLVEALPGRGCDVVGSSLGGWLGAWLAVRHPDLVEHLILSAPAGFRPADAPPLSFAPEAMREQLFAHPERAPTEEKPPQIVEGNRRAIAHYKLGKSFDSPLQARVGEIASQTLILHGTLDVRAPVSAVRMLKQRIPNAQLVYVYDAAHSLETDQPDRVGALMEDFLVRGESFIVNQSLLETGSREAATGLAS